MILYHTYSRFGKTAEDLSDAQLNQDMTESMEIFDMLTGVAEEKAHPTLEMWRGYEFALAIRAMFLNMEYTFRRGYAHHECFRFMYTAVQEIQRDEPDFSYEPPPWFRDAAVVKSHRSNLFRRGYYNEMPWNNCPENWPYIWPKVDGDSYTLWLSRSDKKLIKSGERALPDAATLERIVNWP